MSLSLLSQSEKDIVLECLIAAAEGPFFPDWEFQTLMGVSRERIREIIKEMPDIDDSREDIALAINNSMNHLSGAYPHGHRHDWRKFISVSEEEVDRVLDKWRSDLRDEKQKGQS